MRQVRREIHLSNAPQQHHPVRNAHGCQVQAAPHEAQRLPCEVSHKLAEMLNEHTVDMFVTTIEESVQTCSVEIRLFLGPPDLRQLLKHRHYTHSPGSECKRLTGLLP